MPLIDTFRRTLLRKKKELVKLTNDRVKIQKKLTDYQTKAQKASNDADKSNNLSTIRSKLNQAERYKKSAIQESNKLNKLEEKIAKKNEEIQKEQQKVQKEENKIEKKRQEEHKRKMSNIDSTLKDHQVLHNKTFDKLEELKNLPEKIKVVCFASNPTDQTPLKLDEEVRSIQEMLRKTKYRDSIKLESFWAVRTFDILQAINEQDPAIVHFIGHGTESSDLVFETNNGTSKHVDANAITETMVSGSDNIRLVFFNTCFSKAQAASVVNRLEAAIGMGRSISDGAANTFSAQFYSSIGFGHSVKKAFEQAKASIMLENLQEEEVPELFVQEGLDPNEIFIVQAPENN